MRKATAIIVGMALTGTMLVGCHPNSHKEAVHETATAHQTDSFPDMSVPDMSRDSVSVYNEIRKHDITIIDFWASWCGPCMREMPELVELYADCKGKGLGIVGISLDNDHNAWKEAVEKQGMTWLQLSELRGWDSTIAQANGVRSIPHTVVVDNKGNILAKGLRGNDLRSFVKEKLMSD